MKQIIKNTLFILLGVVITLSSYAFYEYRLYVQDIKTFKSCVHSGGYVRMTIFHDETNGPLLCFHNGD